VAQERRMLETQVKNTDWDITQPEVIPGTEDHHTSPKRLKKMKLDENGERTQERPRTRTRNAIGKKEKR
jgi:hypothetical protein